MREVPAANRRGAGDALGPADLAANYEAVTPYRAGLVADLLGAPWRGLWVSQALPLNTAEAATASRATLRERSKRLSRGVHPASTHGGCCPCLIWW
jgi:hypothetical protein